MLAGLDPLVILYMPCDSTQDDLLHQLPRHRAWGPTHGRQSSMNFSNVGPSHGLQFFTNCSSMGPFHRLQSLRNGGSAMGEHGGIPHGVTGPASKPALVVNVAASEGFPGYTHNSCRLLLWVLEALQWKGIEQPILETISRHMKGMKVIGSSQCEFTKEKSCLNNLITFNAESLGTFYWLEEGKAVDIVNLDFSEAFYTIPILIGKLLMCGLEKQRVTWIENWLNG
ncbi:LOW QUALITY PROTEIN: hypothetical protein QYF61_015646 [Mycteria americana]|uniref:Uncharacterized protein n=1 Tax=Mycteria americana TaxID=33587 RepID=A0AAN7NUG6_MYCAM|nr:LOW QUALITY PROTEIN: hypothetical protein QYF61_015646 [Mycteria americana]